MHWNAQSRSVTAIQYDSRGLLLIVVTRHAVAVTTEEARSEALAVKLEAVRLLAIASRVRHNPPDGCRLPATPEQTHVICVS